MSTIAEQIFTKFVSLTMYIFLGFSKHNLLRKIKIGTRNHERG